MFLLKQVHSCFGILGEINIVMIFKRSAKTLALRFFVIDDQKCRRHRGAVWKLQLPGCRLITALSLNNWQIGTTGTSFEKPAATPLLATRRGFPSGIVRNAGVAPALMSPRSRIARDS